MYTQDLSVRDARYYVRGYFTGDGQHWIAIWDNEDGDYVRDLPARTIKLFASSDNAIAYGQRVIRDFTPYREKEG